MSKEIGIIENNKLEIGNYLMKGNTKLVSVECSFPKMSSAIQMFYNCTALTTFSSGLPSLTNGNGMFYGCKLNSPSVKNIAFTINKTVTNSPRIDLGIDTTISSNAQVKKDIGLIKQKGWNVYINGSNASSLYTLPKYAGCTTVDAIKAKDANYMTTDVVSGAWTEHLLDLTNGSNVLRNCTTITSFSADLSSMTNGTKMFQYCTNLTSFSSNTSKLTNGEYMFNSCSKLSSFTSDLSKLTDGDAMFTFAAFTSFATDLSSLNSANAMFQNCTGLISFTSKMGSLTNGESMFNSCGALTTFSSDVSTLTNGIRMFAYCGKLTSFSSDLSSLTDGTRMFGDCKLDAPSVERILATIPTYTSGSHVLQLGIQSTVASKFAEITGTTPTTTQQTVSYKGWSIQVKITG